MIRWFMRRLGIYWINYCTEENGGSTHSFRRFGRIYATMSIAGRSGCTRVIWRDHKRARILVWQ